MFDTAPNTATTLKALSDDGTTVTIRSLGPEEMHQCEVFDRRAGTRCDQEAAFLVNLSEGTNKTRKMCARDLWAYGIERRGLKL